MFLVCRAKSSVTVRGAGVKAAAPRSGGGAQRGALTPVSTSSRCPARQCELSSCGGRQRGESGRFDEDDSASPSFLLSGGPCLVPLRGRQPVTVARGLQHRRVVHDPVDDRGGGRRVEEDFGPARERQIRRHHEATALVALADEAEEQVGAGLVERDVSQLVVLRRSGRAGRACVAVGPAAAPRRAA